MKAPRDPKGDALASQAADEQQRLIGAVAEGLVVDLHVPVSR
jgi:hypothetical protein